jgi:hypothetical protein
LADPASISPQAFLELIEAFEWKSFTILYEESSGRKIDLPSNSFLLEVIRKFCYIRLSEVRLSSRESLTRFLTLPPT